MVLCGHVLRSTTIPSPHFQAEQVVRGAEGVAGRALREQIHHVSDMLHLSSAGQQGGDDLTGTCCTHVLVAQPDKHTSNESVCTGRYTPEWQSHVLTHLPMYGLLLPLLVDCCHNRLAAARDEGALRDLLRVRGALPRCWLCPSPTMRPACLQRKPVHA